MSRNPMNKEEATRVCGVELKKFLTDVKATVSLPTENDETVNARLTSLGLDPAITQTLGEALKIVLQTDFWEDGNRFKAIWVRGNFMSLAETVFSYTRFKGGIQAILKSLGWNRSPAYRAKAFVETFENALLEMPAEISPAKLQPLLDKAAKAKQDGETFDPALWLDDNLERVSKARTANDVKKMLGLVKPKAKKEPQANPESAPDPRVERIIRANIEMTFTRRDDGSIDVFMTSLFDSQFAGLKNWLNAQDSKADEAADADPAENVDSVGNTPELYQYLVDRVVSTTGVPCNVRPPSAATWNVMNWTKDLIDLTVDHWNALQMEEEKPPKPDVEFILDNFGAVREAAVMLLQDRRATQITGSIKMGRTSKPPKSSGGFVSGRGWFGSRHGAGPAHA
jgi:hypothetical protein